MRLHETPSADMYPVNVLPDLWSFTHIGACPGFLPRSTAATPVAVRTIMATPLPGVAKTPANAELSAVEARTMTPDFAHTSVLVTETTCAVMVKSPLAVC